MKKLSMTFTVLQMITQMKNGLQKLQVQAFISPALLLSGLLVCSLVFLHSSYSNAGGVNSNTITGGSSASSATGSATSSTVTNDDGSTTTTQTTPTVTTTTTTTVTQTEVPNIVKNPTFTNHLGGGSSANWSISTCPGGCAFSPAVGFMVGNGGTITQSFSQSDLFGNDIDSTEQGQGLTFSFGGEVDNNQAANNIPDTWSIRLEMFDSSNSTLGHTEIGSTSIFGPTIQTGNLEINSGYVPASGVLTLFGDSALNGGTCCAAYINDIFTTFVYNSIESEITNATTYSELVSTVSCETLNSCVAALEDTVALVTTIIPTEVSVNSEVAIVAPMTIAPIAELPTPTIPVATVETVQEIAEVTSIETEIDNEIETNTEESGSDIASNENETSEAGSTDTRVRTDSSDEADGEEEENTKPVGVKKVKKASTKRQAKQKAANKIVKSMGKGRYDNTNQVKTLIVMQVLGGQKEFFNVQKIIPDTPDFFTNTTIPDNSISDNNYTSYFLFGGSDSDHNALVESQYRR
tara:strand:+ start:59 stop:1624 length:1566 start_codon:yes stop_codon:yes gene_type:complete